MNNLTANAATPPASPTAPATTDATPHPNENTNILLGVPCYGGNINWHCTKTLIGIATLLAELRIQYYFAFMPQCSLVMQARNMLANLALFHKHPLNKNFFSHLLMIDADGSFEASAVMEMLKANRDIVALPFSQKFISWENIARMLKAGVPPERLPDYNGMAMIIPVNPGKIQMHEPTEVLVAGTGAMLIKKEVFVGLMEKHPEWAYRPVLSEIQARDMSFSNGMAFDFFHAGLNRETGQYDGEDYAFVRAAREAGFSAYMLPWITTTHTGPYDFHCNIPAFTKLTKEAA
jgi:hypothetical protein